jgi:NitT/TauT family transport system substrate-binding protein
MKYRFQMALALIVPITASLSFSSPASATDTVTYNLGWLPQGSQSGIFMSMAKGYYAAENLEVKVVRGYGTIRTTNEVDQGMFDFGYGHPLGVILNRDKGGKTQMVGTINDGNPAGLCWIKGKHKIQQPSDLKGLTAGGAGGAPVHVILPIWLKRNGLAPTDVKLLQMDPGVIEASVVQGRIDLAECWKGSGMAILQTVAKKEGQEIEVLEYGKYNMDIYGAGIVASERTIQQRPDQVKRFVRATYRGYAEALKDPEGATEAILQRYPTLDRDQTRQQVQETSDLLTGPNTKERGLGWQDKQKMERTHEFLMSAYNLKGIRADETYTNEFLARR